MGSNMQRQAVPLLISERPLVGTGMEEVVAHNSSMVVKSRTAGEVTYVDGSKIVIEDEVYHLRKFEGLNERTCLNQTPLVTMGQKIKAGEVLADGAEVVAQMQLAGRLHAAEDAFSLCFFWFQPITLHVEPR